MSNFYSRKDNFGITNIKNAGMNYHLKRSKYLEKVYKYVVHSREYQLKQKSDALFHKTHRYIKNN